VRKALFVFVFSLSNILFSQKYSDFGKEITDKENYIFQDINFINSQDNIKLSGTLICPIKDYTKIIIMAPGSGPDSRNSHYLLVNELLKHGIAVYRFDERGIGQSEGKYKENDIDLYYALKKLTEIDSLSKKNFGIIGHSMGGYSAINTYLKNTDTDFLVLIATPIERDGAFKKRKFETNNKKISLEDVLKNIKIPTLYIAGTEDSFFDADQTFKLIEGLNNKKIETKIIKGLNHFLKSGNDNWRKTGDYKLLYEMNQNALMEIINWINKVETH
jgi:pimeloyl-ACP methyl ester carboxylesterase